MLFLVSHANENDESSYTIKHVYLHASSLLHAHVYVSLFGDKVSPEYYDPSEDGFEGPTENDVNRYLQHTVEYFEQMNKECSQGEHYWHSIKRIQNLDNQYPVVLNSNNEEEEAKFLFKLTIQTNYPCSKHYSDGLTFYDIEQSTNIYQFQAASIENVIEHIFTHVNDYEGLHDLCKQINKTPEELAKTDWKLIETLGNTNIQQCNQSAENCQNEHKINIHLEKISEPIPIFHSNI